MSTRDTPWPAGTPCWIDLTTSDPSAAADFYAELFGWRLQVSGEDTGHYTTASVHDLPAAAVNGMAAPEGMPSQWVTYLATDDLDATFAKAITAGAIEVMGPMDVMAQGRLALAVDPSGAFFGMWQAGRHLGVQVVNEPGTLSWNELSARDYDTARAFYAEVFGFRYDDVPMPEPYRYCTFDVGAEMVGGMGLAAPDVPQDAPSRWNVYFDVADADASLAEVVRLGGSVVQDVMDTPYGRLAFAADPQGAAFSLRQTPASS